MTVEELKEVEHRLTELEQRTKSNTHRLDDAEKAIQKNSDLMADIKELVVEIRYMRSDLNETIQRINTLENRGGDKWEKFKWLIVAGLVTIVLGYLAVQIGIK